MKPVLATFSLNDIVLGNNSANTINDTYPDSGTLISIIINNALTVASILLLALLVFGGVTFIINAGGGDQKKTQKAKSALTGAIIGYTIILLSYIIITIIETITGLNILNTTI